MSSQKGEDEYATFTGKNAEEAEGFIHAVNKRAWAAGKLDDYTWTAKFAYVCFTNKALRWYEELDEETRNDWRLLRSAILAKYTTPPHSPSIVPSSAPAASPPVSVELASAAPPPTATTVRRGRIRVDRQGNGKKGYLAQQSPGTGEVGCSITDDVSNACVFELDTICGTITFQDRVSRLIVRAGCKGWSLEPTNLGGSPAEHGVLCNAPPGSSVAEGFGVKWDDIWSIGPDGKVMATLKRQDGSPYTLEVLLSRVYANTIYLVSETKAFVDCYRSLSCQAATLIFEPVS